MKTVMINGMHCSKCKERCERALNSLDGVTCEVDLDKKKAIVNGEVSNEKIIELIEDLGFEVVEIK